MTADPGAVGAVYDRHALAWDIGRHDVAKEAAIQTEWLAGLAQGGEVLELGCGSGRPIGPRVLDAGMRYCGVDISGNMLALAREHLPLAVFLQADMSRLNLARQVDGIISWDGFFHLTPDAQRQALPILAGHLRPHGKMLMSVGHYAGEVTGHVQGTPVYHASLSENEYRRLLSQAGCKVTAFRKTWADAGGRSLLYATKQ